MLSELNCDGLKEFFLHGSLAPVFHVCFARGREALKNCRVL